jgi:hypothetical protein
VKENAIKNPQERVKKKNPGEKGFRSVDAGIELQTL